MFPSYLGNPAIVTTLLLGLLIWVAGLSWYLFKAVAHYRGLVKDTDAQGLQSVLDKLIKNQQKAREDISLIEESVLKMRQAALRYLQHVGFVRFNPFEETGGDQSFVVAFLDVRKNGLVISSLHTRAGTRMYAKAVKEGKGIKHSLSKEEEEAVRQAVS